MYIKKSVLGMMTSVLGISVLAVLCVLFCFAQTNIPTIVYGLCWMGCLAGMLRAAARISRG